MTLSKKALLARFLAAEKRKKYEYHDLRLIDKVYYCAFLLALSGPEPGEAGHLKYLANHVFTLSPKLDLEIVKHLNNLGLITVSPDMTVDDVILSEDGMSIEIDYSNILFTVKHDCIDLISEMTEEKFRSEAIKDKRFIKLCERVTLDECVIFFNDILKENNVNYKLKQRDIGVFKDLLDVFSVSQIYSIIDKGIASYAMNKVKDIRGPLKLISEYAVETYGSDMQGYFREQGREQTFLSVAIFDIALGVKDGGFDYKLGEILT